MGGERYLSEVPDGDELCRTCLFNAGRLRGVQPDLLGDEALKPLRPAGAAQQQQRCHQSERGLSAKAWGADGALAEGAGHRQAS